MLQLFRDPGLQAVSCPPGNKALASECRKAHSLAQLPTSLFFGDSKTFQMKEAVRLFKSWCKSPIWQPPGTLSSSALYLLGSPGFTCSKQFPEHLTVSHFKLLRFLQHPGRFFFLQKIQEQCRAADGPQEHPPISGGRKLGSRCPSPPSSSRTVTGPRCPHWSLVQCRSLPYPSQSPYPSASWGQRPNKLLACRETQTNSCVGATATEKARKQQTQKLVYRGCDYLQGLREDRVVAETAGGDFQAAGRSRLGLAMVTHVR